MDQHDIIGENVEEHFEDKNSGLSGRESTAAEAEDKPPVFDFPCYSADIVSSCQARFEAKLNELYMRRDTMQLPRPKGIDTYQHKRYYPEGMEDMMSASQ